MLVRVLTEDAMRPLFSILFFLFLTTCFMLSCSQGKKAPSEAEPSGAPATPTPPKTEAPPAPPYKLTDKDEIEIDQASNRRQLYVLSKKETEEALVKYQGKLKECDGALAKQDDSCRQRFATLYCMLIGDRYFEQGRFDEALASYLDAIKRTYNENQQAMRDLEEVVKKDPNTSETARLMTREYNAARFHYQAYKDFGEIARYQKRIIELELKRGNDDNAKEQWKFVEESVKGSAEHKKAFLKNFETLTSIKDKIPEKYMGHFKEIADLAADLKIEPI